jgi:hypothetical protein
MNEDGLISLRDGLIDWNFGYWLGFFMIDMDDVDVFQLIYINIK